MADLAIITPKLAKLLPMLATNHDGEVLATVRAIDRTLKGAGLDFHALVEALQPVTPSVYSPPPRPEPKAATMSMREMALWCRGRDAGDLTAKERRFVWDMVRRTHNGGSLTPKQEKWLRSIHSKLDWGYVP